MTCPQMKWILREHVNTGCRYEFSRNHIVDSAGTVLTRRSLSSATQNQNWERSDQPKNQPYSLAVVVQVHNESFPCLSVWLVAALPVLICAANTEGYPRFKREQMPVSQLCNCATRRRCSKTKKAEGLSFCLANFAETKL